MLDILLFGLIAGVFAWWLVTLAYKRGWLEWLQIHAPNDIIHTLFSCHYCMSWWSSLAACIAAALVTGNWALLVSAFIGTFVGVKLLN
jgi:hypothetical protein